MKACFHVAENEVVEPATAAQGQKKSVVENVQERCEQITANLKLCADLFSPAEKRASKLFAQVKFTYHSFNSSYMYTTFKRFDNIVRNIVRCWDKSCIIWTWIW